MGKPPDHLSTADAVTRLGLSPASVNALVAKGLLVQDADGITLRSLADFEVHRAAERLARKQRNRERLARTAAETTDPAKKTIAPPHQGTNHLSTAKRRKSNATSSTTNTRKRAPEQKQDKPSSRSGTRNAQTSSDLSPPKQSINLDNSGDDRPTVFIGSSAEGLPVAEALQVLLDHHCEVEPWTQGLFEPGGSTLQALVQSTPRFDFAILVVSPDDTTQSRGRLKQATRDNVVFELGLFMGALGSNRTFMVYDRTRLPDLPSDLAGVTVADFAPHKSGNLTAALGASATRIRAAMKRLGLRELK